jgi:hypothetical protein
MGRYSFGDLENDNDEPIPAAYVRRFGNARVPTSGDVRAWEQGLLGADPRSRQFDIDGHRIIDASPKAPVDRHPVTGRFAAPWKDKPTGRGMAAQLRVRFKPGDPRAVAAGRRSTPAKRMSSRENLKLANEAGRKKQRPPRPKPEGVSGA